LRKLLKLKDLNHMDKDKQQQKIIEALETVIDPEIGIDVWTLGLIYHVTTPTPKKVHVLMTFTTPLCPFGGQLKQEVEDALKAIGFAEVEIELTFKPSWEPPAELRDILGI